MTNTITACKFTAVPVKTIKVYEGNMGVAPPIINLYIRWKISDHHLAPTALAPEMIPGWMVPETVGAFSYNICSVYVLNSDCAGLDLVWYSGILCVTLYLGVNVY